MNGTTMSEEIKPRKRRLRAVPEISADIRAEIEREATTILRQRMIDARKAAALEIIARKLGEIQSIIQAFGLKTNLTPIQAGLLSINAAQQVPPVKNPCVQCGKQGMWQSPRNKLWYCATSEKARDGHALKQRMDEAEDTVMLSSQPFTNPSLPPVPSNG
jgi:hypothetical protein